MRRAINVSERSVIQRAPEARREKARTVEFYTFMEGLLSYPVLPVDLAVDVIGLALRGGLLGGGRGQHGGVLRGGSGGLLIRPRGARGTICTKDKRGGTRGLNIYKRVEGKSASGCADHGAYPPAATGPPALSAREGGGWCACFWASHDSQRARGAGGKNAAPTFRFPEGVSGLAGDVRGGGFRVGISGRRPWDVGRFRGGYRSPPQFAFGAAAAAGNRAHPAMGCEQGFNLFGHPGRCSGADARALSTTRDILLDCSRGAKYHVCFNGSAQRKSNTVREYFLSHRRSFSPDLKLYSPPVLVPSRRPAKMVPYFW